MELGRPKSQRQGRLTAAPTGWLLMKNDTKQIDRFKDAARQAGADEAPDALDRAFGKLDLRHKPEPVPEGKPVKPGKGE